MALSFQICAANLYGGPFPVRMGLFQSPPCLGVAHFAALHSTPLILVDLFALVLTETVAGFSQVLFTTTAIRRLSCLLWDPDIRSCYIIEMNGRPDILKAFMMPKVVSPQTNDFMAELRYIGSASRDYHVYVITTETKSSSQYTSATLSETQGPGI